jgi:hypothetical protein
MTFPFAHPLPLGWTWSEQVKPGKYLINDARDSPNLALLELQRGRYIDLVYFDKKDLPQRLSASVERPMILIVEQVGDEQKFIIRDPENRTEINRIGREDFDPRQ